jgi:hypothetical protein
VEELRVLRYDGITVNFVDEASMPPGATEITVSRRSAVALAKILRKLAV